MLKKYVEDCSASREGLKFIPKMQLPGENRWIGFSNRRTQKFEIILAYDMTESALFENQLAEKIAQLERFRRLAVERELTMIEMKNEIDALKRSIEGAHV